MDMAQRRAVGSIGLAWLVTIAIDFFVFGGVFVGLLEESSSAAVLSPEELFRRIPAGYASFLLEVLLLAWLLRSTGSRGVTAGVRTGLRAGGIFATAVVLGLWSFTTVPVVALMVWWLTLMLQFTAAGAVLGASSTSAWRPMRRWSLVVVVLLVAGGTVLQNAGAVQPLPGIQLQ